MIEKLSDGHAVGRTTNDGCRTCKYRYADGAGMVCCQYILITGKRRGCKGGPGCLKYKRGTPLKEIKYGKGKENGQI